MLLCVDIYYPTLLSMVDTLMMLQSYLIYLQKFSLKPPCLPPCKEVDLFHPCRIGGLTVSFENPIQNMRRLEKPNRLKQNLIQSKLKFRIFLIRRFQAD